MQGVEDEDIEASYAEWMREEADEKLRQLRFRWSVFERSLPPGMRCDERLLYESQVYFHRRIRCPVLSQAVTQ